MLHGKIKETYRLEATVRKYFLLLFLGIVFIFPTLVSAQSEIKLKSAQVQLWPEYDQPSMLVIYDFVVDVSTPLPAQVTFRLPKEANIIAVAFDQGGSLLNATFKPEKKGDWQYLTITVDAVTTYHFEYYEPLNINGNTRAFNYSLPVDYATESFTVKVREPLDTVSLKGDPGITKTDENGVAYYVTESKNLAAGTEFTFALQYEKTTSALVVPPTEVQTGTINENTSGRLPLNSYLPYILGGIGVVLIVGGVAYYFFSGRTRGRSSRRRRHAHSEVEENDDAAIIHCSQCGTRARPNDRFCRTCGSRLRVET